MFGFGKKTEAVDAITDLSAFGKRSDHENAQEMRVVAPDGSLTGIYVSCLGYLSDAFAQAKQDLARVVLEGESVPDAKAKLLAAVVTGWRGLTENGVEVAYSKDRAIELMREYPDLANQVDAFISRNENFTKG